MTTISQELDTINSIIATVNKFNIKNILRRFGASKLKGFPPFQILCFLLNLSFTKTNIFQHFKKNTIEFSKDTVYRFLNDTKIHWEQILFTFAIAVITKIRTLTDEKRRCAIVIDDSPYYRNRSKKVELLSKVYDHSEGGYFMGFRMLTMGFTDGVSFVPLAEQLLSSENTKVCEAAKKDRRTIAGNRRDNALRKAPAVMCSMLCKAKKMKVPANYVLVDSWFSSPCTLIDINNSGFDAVSMLKKNKTHYFLGGHSFTLGQLHRSLKKRPGLSKYLASVIVTIKKKEPEQSMQVKIVFVRDKNDKKNWCALISTDIKLSEEEIIELYGKRWSIETFFKTCKTYLRLAKEFQGRSFDMLTAHTTIVFMRYICLAWIQRVSQDSRTLGDLCYLLSDEIADISFSASLALIIDLLRQTLTDCLFLTKQQVDTLLDTFIEKLPKFLQLLPSA
jgi:hypothetical protein